MKINLPSPISTYLISNPPPNITNKIEIDRNKKNREIEIEKEVLKNKHQQAKIIKAKDSSVNKRQDKRERTLYFVFIF